MGWNTLDRTALDPTTKPHHGRAGNEHIGHEDGNKGHHRPNAQAEVEVECEQPQHPEVPQHIPDRRNRRILLGATCRALAGHGYAHQQQGHDSGSRQGQERGIHAYGVPWRYPPISGPMPNPGGEGHHEHPHVPPLLATRATARPRLPRADVNMQAPPTPMTIRSIPPPPGRCQPEKSPTPTTT